jgi:hypothetical protein
MNGAAPELCLLTSAAKNCAFGCTWKIEFLSKIERVRGEIRPPLYH